MLSRRLFEGQSTLEFELRLQQYIEMIRDGDRTRFGEALGHAKRYLTPYVDSQSAEIRRAAGLLAFPSDTQIEPYKVCVSLCEGAVVLAVFCRRPFCLSGEETRG